MNLIPATKDYGRVRTRIRSELQAGVDDIDPRRTSVYEEKSTNRYAVILQERRRRKFERTEHKRHIPHLNKHARESKRTRWEMWAE